MYRSRSVGFASRCCITRSDLPVQAFRRPRQKTFESEPPAFVLGERRPFVQFGVIQQLEAMRENREIELQSGTFETYLSFTHETGCCHE
jgi:hypothetical protein